MNSCKLGFSSETPSLTGEEEKFLEGKGDESHMSYLQDELIVCDGSLLHINSSEVHIVFLYDSVLENKGARVSIDVVGGNIDGTAFTSQGQSSAIIAGTIYDQSLSDLIVQDKSGALITTIEEATNTTSLPQGNLESHVLDSNNSESLPELDSSHTTLEVNVSRTAEAEVRKKGRTVLSGEKSTEDKENVSDNNNGPENIVSEPRRSRRRIQPTRTLLEGLQTSFTSHKRSTNYKPWEILKCLPELNSSHTTLEVNVSTAAEAEVRRKGRTVLLCEKSIEDKENVSDNNNGPENIVSEFSEPKRSRRRIQPTQTLLDGLQTSFTSHKTSHKRGTNYRSCGKS